MEPNSHEGSAARGALIGVLITLTAVMAALAVVTSVGWPCVVAALAGVFATYAAIGGE